MIVPSALRQPGPSVAGDRRLSPFPGVPSQGAVAEALTRGKLTVMREDDREQRTEDETTHRTGDQDTPAPQAPVIRSLANPRRIRRA